MIQYVYYTVSGDWAIIASSNKKSDAVAAGMA